MRPRVFVTRAIASDAVAMLRRHAEIEVWPRATPPPYAQILRRARAVEALLTMVTDRIDAALIAAAPKLRVISNLAVGLDNIDVAAASAAGIAVGHTPGVLTEATADLAFALLMATARRIAEGDREVRAGKWQTWGPSVLLGQDVWGATLGIIGWGQIGRAMARRGLGFNMRVLYASRSSHDSIAGAKRLPMARLLRESDFVSLHVPLTPQTRGLIGTKELATMKRGAILINTARGGVVDQRALYRALKSGHLAGAGLDVTTPEPIASNDPHLKLPNVVITPHIGSASYTSRNRMAEIATDNIIEVLRGRLPRFCANPEVTLRSG
ncbi:MAG TPA: D-glycerate dehydrogenase [Candidatus Binataceae bacterium]|nr:D-glycerate dehydrogenase [Candidatus Binataceae bacterium]